MQNVVNSCFPFINYTQKFYGLHLCGSLCSFDGWDDFCTSHPLMCTVCDPTASVTQGRVLNAEQKGVLLSSLLCLEDGAAVLGPGGSWPSLRIS